MSLTGSIISSIEQDWKYLCRPIDAETVRVIDHNSIKRGKSAPQPAEAVNYAYSNLSVARDTSFYQQQIKLACLDYPFNLEDRITPSNFSVLDAKLASIRLKDGVNKSLWEWIESEQGTPLVNAEVRGGNWYGNKAQQTEGCGFKVYNTSGVNNLAVRLRDIHVGSIKDDAFFIQIYNQRMEMIDNWTSGIDNPPEGIGGRGIYLRSISDSLIKGGGYQGALEGLYSDITADLSIEGVYFGGGSALATSGYQVVMKYAKRPHIVNSRVMDCDKGGIQLINSGGNPNYMGIISSTEVVSDNLDADNAYIAIALEDTTHHMIIQGCPIGFKGVWVDENGYQYGVREVDAECDWNEVGPNTYNAIKTADVSLQGANSTDHQ